MLAQHVYIEDGTHETREAAFKHYHFTMLCDLSSRNLVWGVGFRVFEGFGALQAYDAPPCPNP